MHCVALVNPPERPGYTNERTLSGGLGVARKRKPWERPQTLLPPHDLLLAAAVAEKSGAAVQVIDLMLDRCSGDSAVAETVRRIQSSCAAGAVTWIGVRLSMPSLPADIAFADRLKSALPSARLFLFCAAIMSTLDHWSADTRADAVLYGEPEAVIGPMLAAAGDDWKRVPGVIVPAEFRPLSGPALYDGSVQARFREWVMNADVTGTPFPAYHLLPMERYSPTGRIEDCGVYLSASRGCPIGCTMCPYMLHEGRPLRPVEAERVLAEMEWLNSTWGIYRWRFKDPNFGFDRKQVREILSGVIERGIRMEATVEGSLECMDDPLIELMSRAGVKVITTGIETADEECLASIGQKIRVNEILAKKISYADSLGIHVYGTFVVGAPEETWSTVQSIVDYARQVPCEAGFTIMTPFPGTPMYYRALKEGLVEPGMSYTRWNSYEATMRTYSLSRGDLTLARLWARLEVIIPYARRHARAAGMKTRIAVEARLLPRRAALVLVRAAVAWRRHFARPAPPRPAERRVIEKIPLHW
jgi:radical SAM superfamily enzyme YgiQ (UPF0313 family)